MKKIATLLSLLFIAVSASAAGHNDDQHKSDAIYESVRQQYTHGRISADSVAGVGLYHKAWSPALAERCLKLAAADGNLRSTMELGVLYAFSPEFSSRQAEGLKLLEAAAKGGSKEANEYLGLYYFNHGDYTRAKSCFDAGAPFKNGFAYAALGSMYMDGNGVAKNSAKVRESYHQAALKGYPRGEALYGFNLRTKTGGAIDYPDSFFWLYIGGDLGDDAARTTLYLPRLNHNTPTTETEKKALTALQFIEMAQRGKSIKNDPLYKDGFLKGLKAQEQAAEQGDDWARYYLGSMNYNGDFLNQNYAQALRYYEPIARNGKLPRTALAVVNERLAEMYRDGKGTKADASKADHYMHRAAQYGSLTAYKTVEKITR
ncbi:MAG: sel1 repeat family protein [Muribaculaceae bacterium]|nr:sel1 repeat family protein [Muribaculaceae bacterium]